MLRRALAFATVAILLTGCKDERRGADSPYPPCDDQSEPCGPSDGFCMKLDGASVCVPHCASDSECPAFENADVMCGSLCFLFCGAPQDCPTGMVCSKAGSEEIGNCAWPDE